MPHKGFTVWLTGLSAAGKSTIAVALADALRKRGRQVEILDGDELRTHLSRDPGFSREDCDLQVRRVGWVAQLLTRNGVAVISAVLSPYRNAREASRRLIGNFIEVYVKASPEACSERDVKGLRKKALNGEAENFTGVSGPYEPPENPEVICDTKNETLEESTAKILTHLERTGYLPAADNEQLKARLKGLGYL